MNQPLPKHDWPCLVTVFLAFGGIGMLIIFSFLIGFGIHAPVGKVSLYICFGLQMLNVLTLALRRHVLRKKYGAPAHSKKMRHFLGSSLIVWFLGALCLMGSLVLHLFWFDAYHGLVMIPCLIGTIIAPLGWLGLLASFHRIRQNVLLRNS